jgi:N-acetylneuraminic acid mutarotase
MIRATATGFATSNALALIVLPVIALVAILAGGVQAQASGTWSTTGSLNTPRTAHTATLLQNGEVLATGGESTAGTILASAELYSPATDRWTVTGSTSVPRVDHTATLLPNGEVLVAGGYLGLSSSDQPIYTATAELYNPATEKWTRTGSMTTPRASHGATLLENGLVLVEGGNSSTASSGNTAELYNPATGTWKATGTMENFHPYVLVTMQDGRALAIDESGSTGPSELYTPSTGEWTLTSTMYYSHTGVSAAILTSGDVLVYGNKLGSYTSEFYNPLTNVWARTQGQSENDVNFGPLALLENGKVLLGGGSTVYNGKSAATTNARLYNPSTNSWTATGSLKEAVSHSLTRLLTGQVLAVGGSDAELYTP